MSARSNDTAKSCSDLLVVLMLAMSAVGTKRTSSLGQRSAMSEKRTLKFSLN